jgi:hypothetical protein
MKETSWKNNLNIVKDVLMIYVNFIAIGIIISEKTGGNCFLTNFRIQFFRE